jgi:hypothetical protein
MEGELPALELFLPSVEIGVREALDGCPTDDAESESA